RRLALAGRHQVAVSTYEIMFLAHAHMRIVLRANVFTPNWPRTGIAPVVLGHRPWARQRVVDHRDLVVHHIAVCFVERDALLDDALIILVKRDTGRVVDARTLEAARFDFQHIVAAVAVLIDPGTERISEI